MVRQQGVNAAHACVGKQRGERTSVRVDHANNDVVLQTGGSPELARGVQIKSPSKRSCLYEDEGASANQVPTGT